MSCNREGFQVIHMSRTIFLRKKTFFLVTLVILLAPILFFYTIFKIFPDEPLLHETTNYPPSSTLQTKQHTLSSSATKRLGSTIGAKRKCLILVWTSYFGRMDWPYVTELRESCPLIKNGLCEITNDKNQLENSNAVIFNWFDVLWNILIIQLPKTKVSNQKWILMNFDPPAIQPLLMMKYAGDKLRAKIDWTVSYRVDSDIFVPYGSFRPRSEKEKWDKPKSEELLFESRSLLVWLTSRCDTSSKREHFVNLLRKNVNVDIFGLCGNWATDCRGSKIQCYRHLSKKYKFYLAFENSICVEYVTEKLFLALAAGMVPVVLGGANYSRIAPKGSYIDVMDFETPNHLAKYLVEVGNNYTLYKSYLEWNKDFVINYMEKDDLQNRIWICDLCQKLLDSNALSEKNKSEPRDLNNWWFDEGKCETNPKWDKIKRFNPNSIKSNV